MFDINYKKKKNNLIVPISNLPLRNNRNQNVYYYTPLAIAFAREGCRRPRGYISNKGEIAGVKTWGRGRRGEMYVESTHWCLMQNSNRTSQPSRVKIPSLFRPSFLRFHDAEGNIWRNLGRHCQGTGDIFNVWGESGLAGTGNCHCVDVGRRGGRVQALVSILRTPRNFVRHPIRQKRSLVIFESCVARNVSDSSIPDSDINNNGDNKSW